MNESSGIACYFVRNDGLNSSLVGVSAVAIERRNGVDETELFGYQLLLYQPLCWFARKIADRVVPLDFRERFGRHFRV